MHLYEDGQNLNYKRYINKHPRPAIGIVIRKVLVQKI
jgi:hypothetical protein